jgi:predicted nucleic acid-binding Zn ribbon protein
MGILFEVKKCVFCNKSFTTRSAEKYCSDKCKKAAFDKLRAGVAIINSRR